MKNAIYRLLINWYQASDKPLPKWLERACEQNDALAFERELGEDLTASLKKRPNDSSPIEGDNMAARVMKQITEEDYLAEQQQNEKRAPWGAWVRSAGMAVAAVAIVAVSIQFLDTPGPLPVDPTLSQNVPVDPSINLEDELLEIGSDWKNPLDQEIEYIVSDAKGALGFLANSFVPSSLLKKSEEPGNA